MTDQHLHNPKTAVPIDNIGLQYEINLINLYHSLVITHNLLSIIKKVLKYKFNLHLE